MGRKGDKDYITYSEWAADFGGAKASGAAYGAGSSDRPTQTQLNLPFNCCSLSLQPFAVPVCSADGFVFDLSSIVPYLRLHKNTHPHTGMPLQPSELIRLRFHRNAIGDYHCPVLLKTFSPHTKIVANRVSGNVYCAEAVEEMNFSRGYWKDLITEQPFQRSDIIVLQDPLKPKAIAKRADLPSAAVSPNVSMTGGVGRVLAELQKELGKQREEDAAKKASRASDTDPSILQLDQLDDLAKSEFSPTTTGTAAVRTSFGDLFFTLHCGLAPRCCYNFITLARKGYYDGVLCHRLVKGFVLQGGDPTGTGSGGESCWKRPFGEAAENTRLIHSIREIAVNSSDANRTPKASSLSHSQRGILSMANANDPSANGSQFFITFKACKHLDGKHPVFGKLLAGAEILDRIESEVETDQDNRPSPPVKIVDVIILDDPFEEAQTRRQQMSAAKTKSTNTKQTIPPSAAPTRSSIGKYLPQVKKPTHSRTK